MEKNSKNWSIIGIWNEEENLDRYEIKARDYINATDIGKPFLDRYYKMIGEPETNPFEPRILRIFSAGEEFHFLLRRIFRKIGFLIDYEQRIEIPATETLLKVVGYYDMKLGGNVNLVKAEEAINKEDFSDFIKAKALKIAKYFAERYPNGLEPVICEVKSVNSLAFVAHQHGKGYLKDVYPHHVLQIYTYLKATGIRQGRLLYISKDNLLIEEHLVNLNDRNWENLWQLDIKTMSDFYRNKVLPPRESDIVKDEEGKWKPNWRIERSTYLTKITGFKDKKEWMEYAKNLAKEENKKSKKSKKNEKSKSQN